MKFIFSCSLLFLGMAVHAQNLVPNPSFEEISLCPDYVAQIERATGWQQNAGSPDYFNSCDTTTIGGLTGWASVPSNFVGYQSAATGTAYIGLCTYLDSTFSGAIGSDAQHEYVGITLTEPLLPGVPVYVSFLTSATYGSGSNDRPRYTCSGIGARFAFHALDLFDPDTADNISAVHLEQVLFDSVGWTLVYGEYIPDSAYQYLLLGNFYDKEHCSPTLIAPAGNEGIAYAYIDNVCVSYDPDAYLSTGIQQQHQLGCSSVRPVATWDPRNAALLIDHWPTEGICEVVVTDELGRELLRNSTFIGHGRTEVCRAPQLNGAAFIVLRVRNERETRCFKLITSP